MDGEDDLNSYDALNMEEHGPMYAPAPFKSNKSHHINSVLYRRDYKFAIMATRGIYFAKPQSPQNGL